MDTRIRLLVAAVVLLILSAAGVRAQEATVISGRITTRADGLSLPGGTRTFPRNAPFGFNGRYVYARLTIAM